jgi:S1-C subfamily serine protease
MIEKNKNGIVVIVLLSTLFGLVAGIVGSLTVRSYFGTSSAFFGELNFVNGNLDKPNVVISGAKKVVVAQDEKINETISLVNVSLVGIYQKKATSTKKEMIDLDSFYKIGDELGAGLIVTSDGWIVTDALNHLEFVGKNKQLNMGKYVVIGNDKKIYTIDKIEIDPSTNYIFLHINARDLAVLNMASQDSLNTGETALGLTLAGDTYLSTVSSVRDSGNYLSISSDFYYDKIKLVDDLSENFNSSFIFDVSGRIVMFINKKGELIPSRVFNVVVDSLFEKGVISRPSLGLDYADLSYFISSDTENKNFQESGALVNPSPKSSLLPWFEAGIKIGDIIKYIDGAELNKNNSLAKIIMTYAPGDEVEFGLLRGAEELQIRAILAELK